MAAADTVRENDQGLVEVPVLRQRVGMGAVSVFLILATGGLYLPLAAARAGRLEVERFRFRGIALDPKESAAGYVLPSILVLAPIWASLAIFGFEGPAYDAFVLRPALTAAFVMGTWVSLVAGLVLFRRQRESAFARARWLNLEPVLDRRMVPGPQMRTAMEAALETGLAARPELRRALGEGSFGLRPDGRVIGASLVFRGECLAMVDKGARRAVTYGHRQRLALRSVLPSGRTCRFADGSIFVARSDDHAAGAGRSWLAWAEAFHPRLVLWIAGSLAILAAMSLLVAPAALRLAVALTPFSVEDDLTVATLTSMDGAILEETAIPQERRALVEDSFARLVAIYDDRADARPDPSFGILFRRSELMGANAIALPSGQIVITDGFLELVEDDQAIAAVLAHEIGHVHHRHSLYKLYRGIAVQGISALLGGDMSRMVERGLIQAAFLSNLASSRAMEREADALSVELSLRAGIAPGKLTEALRVLTSACGDCEEPSWLSTHPTLEDRTRRIDALIKEQ
jgi:Zn-dependent protease with chaperone function